MRRISAGPGRRASGLRRFSYQATASFQSCSRLTIGRTGSPRAVHLRHAFLRPEEEHRRSGVYEVRPPLRRGHGEVGDDGLGVDRSLSPDAEMNRLESLLAA